MTVFATLKAPQATEPQITYLTSLFAARFAHKDEVPEPLRCFLPRTDMTVEEASHAIDIIKAIPSLWEREKIKRQQTVERWQVWMLGEKGRERDAEARWDDVLAWHFYIRRQVNGTHFSGKRLRIDRMLSPRKWAWGCGHQHEVGFEIKASVCQTDAAQAADYANTKWDGTPDEYTIVGLYRWDRDKARPLAGIGCFAFVVEHNWKIQGPALTLCWNGNRMWTGSLTGESRDIPALPWCPSRKFGSR